MTLADSVDSMTFDLLEVPIVDKDVEGAVDNTTLDGNIFTDYLWLKKNYVQKWSIMCDNEYSRLRGFYTRQFDNASVPTYKLFYGENISQDQAVSGNYILVNNPTEKNAPITSFDILGDAEQDGTPTPDSPIPVQVVTGEQTVKIEGKNLFNLNEMTDNAEASGITVDNLTSNSIAIHSTSGVGGYASRSFTAPLAKLGVRAGNTVTISMDSLGSYSGNSGRACRIYYNNTSTTRLAKITSEVTSASFSIPNDATSLLFLFYVADGQTPTTNSTANFYNIQLELGSATAYEPYQGQTLPVNLGKNLLPISQSSATATVASISATSNDDGTITLNGTANATGWLEFVYAFRNGTTQQTTPTIKLDASATYILSSTVLSGTITGTPFIAIQKNATSSTTNANIGESASFTGSDGIYRGFVRVASGQVFNNAKIGIQVEAGISASSFAPYFTPIELAKIGNYQDRIYKDDGKWYIEKQVGKVVLDGSESWARSQSGTTNLYAYWLAVPNSSIPNWNTTTPAKPKLCDNFTYKNEEWKTVTSPCLCENSGLTPNMCIFSGFADITTIADWQTWLASNPTTVYYPLATPTTTEITNSELVGQLEAILQAYLYSGTNNVSNNAVSPNLAGQMNIGYKLIFSEETVLIEPTAVRLTLTDGGIINVCGCRQNVQLSMRETIQ